MRAYPREQMCANPQCGSVRRGSSFCRRAQAVCVAVAGGGSEARERWRADRWRVAEV